MVLSICGEGPLHGYEIIRRIEAKFDGAYVPSPGAIYPTLSWLAEMGFVTLEEEDGRKQAVVTEAGQAFLNANVEALDSIWSRRPGPGKHSAPREVVRAMDALKDALRQRLGGRPAPAEVTTVATRISALAEEIAEAPAEEQQIVTRHKFEPKRRDLIVRETGYLTPHMIRMVLEGDELADFVSPGFDDHVKLILPTDGDKPAMRDYTPRAYDTEARTLVLDFAVHDAGPATDWAVKARAGDGLTIGGPRGSREIAQVFDWWLLVGDETALPAIGRQVEALAAGTRVVTLAAVVGPEDEQAFETGADHTAHWVHRPETQAADPESLLAAVRDMTLPEGRGFVWIAAEAGVARALRDHFTSIGHPPHFMKAAGYWTAGTADTSDKTL